MRLRYLLPFACLVLFLASGGTPAQNPKAEAETLRAVEQRARQDAQAERPRATIQDLSVLYGERAKAEDISLDQVVDAYEDAYAAARPPKSLFKEYLPHLGWLTALVLFILTFFRDTLRDVLGPRLKALGDKLYDRLAGYPVFWWRARANYRQSLVGLYKRFKIPFMADRHLDMDQIYVPLKVEGASDIDQIVDFGEVARFKRLVVTGQPGSGKSMLLRRLALLHATGGLKKLPDHPTPVLFELHRLNKEDKGIFEHLVAIFRLHKFPEADTFIRRSLTRGKLMLLFDGLDEVDSGKRAAEVKKIRDFIVENDACRVIVTCRSAVYRGEFDDLADQKLEIVDFSDQQIESFLKAWPGMPANKSVGQLLAALNERPLIKALARRPLLLTIIAFLYTEVEEFRLPHSRADFYKRAAEVLLGGLKGELNKYEAVEKQFVLEHLALFNQTKKAKSDDDRLTLERQTVLAEIRKLMPEMSRKEEDAPAVLEEIVERSSLMLPLDNKSRYIFSHLTLQEYFAASALRTNHAKLLEHFAADKDAWRETAKLWCGLAQDSSDFIGELYKLDPVAALECLADAKRLTTKTADLVIDAFKTRLGQSGVEGEAINKAFAAAATGDTPRNRSVFDFLVGCLHDGYDRRAQSAAIAALSLTNNAEAAAHLAQLIPDVPEAEAALVRMGDFAVPALEARIKADRDAVYESPLMVAGLGAAHPIGLRMQALASIGTPKAVEVLVRLLWHPGEVLPAFAALTLGSHLQLPQVEAAVRAAQLPPESKLAESYRWVWSPFEEGESTMSVTAGRIVYLIAGLPALPASDYTLDPRIGIPLVIYRSHMLPASLLTWGRLLRKLDSLWPIGSEINHVTDEELREFFLRQAAGNPIRELLKRSPVLLDYPPGLMAVLEPLSLLDSPHQVRLLRRLARVNRPTISHWQNIFNPAKFSLRGSLQHQLISLILFTLPAFSVAGFLLTLTSSPRWLTAQTILSGLALLLVLFVEAAAVIGGEEDELAESFVTDLLFTPLTLVGVRHSDLRTTELITMDERLGQIILGLHIPLNVYLGSLLLSQWLNVPWIVTLWVALLGSLYFLYWLAKRKERLSGNPLSGLFEKRAAENGRRLKL